MEEQEHGISLENFLNWAAELGISDSPTRSVPFCLGHSLSLAYFPHAGGYFQSHSQLLTSSWPSFSPCFVADYIPWSTRMSYVTN